MSESKAEAWLAQHPEIESIFACVCDLNGTMRGKRGRTASWCSRPGIPTGFAISPGAP